MLSENNDHALQSDLKALELSDTEIKVYLQLLQTGSTPASSLAKRLHMSRSTVFYTLEKLREKGIAKYIERNNSFLFSPENPSKIESLLHNDLEKIREKQKILDRIIPSLHGISNDNISTPKIEFFEGIDQVKKAYMELPKKIPEGSNLLCYASILPKTIKQQKSYEEVLIEFEKNRLEKNIFIKTLLPKGFDSNRTLINEEVRIIESMNIFHKSASGLEIYIYNDTMYAFTVNGSYEFAYFVTQKELVSMYKYIFHALWEISSKIK